MKNEKSLLKVSICCLTYNQEKYISKCLDSLLEQETNFLYEIIIHDDASTDNTAKIISEYEKKYPNIIKPIYQKENQYSKNSQKVLEFALNKTKGKYIALCEGDDYWIDKNKLQKQYDFLEQNKDCTILGADYEILEGKKITKRVTVFSEECKVSIPEFINRKASIQTATLFFRKKDLLPLPKYYYNAHIGDIPIELHLISKGYMHYVPQVVSVYRFQTEGSYSMKNKNNISKKISNHNKTKNIYIEFNKATKYQYDEILKEYLLKYDFDFYLSIDNIKELKQKKYRKLYKKIAINKKLKMHLKNNKIIYKLYKKIVRK